MDGVNKLFGGMRIAATGMSAERVRIDTVARNIANASVTKTPEGGPYRRQVVEFEPLLAQAQNGGSVNVGVRVRAVREDMQTPFNRVNDPTHADAGKDGHVSYPNVNATREMADLITAMRAYEANVSAQDGFVRMAERALRLLQ
ncbi:MAG: flagellar basal body rod protein FlgC [Planctomycetaceae bacterium]|jgi:flagellar basal-body rod protein FlgC|nr:flagellar basal body rod protein FlgC [Planctomycetaceae bacterium]